ncbi:hypothetical protein [Uliginosibacterium sp. 31-12]|uniref:hypothetical protein n=1 Tax=Uliginosibacterium sp. 31-12 TaxID=3062781 RepID=UPI0026E1C22D|nr:hypothetical protein [Uliginosibacterium sp. 31-12]MDO6384899.1 hypothetical protein [Uliginosibacterium sp. 31-12]
MFFGAGRSREQRPLNLATSPGRVVAVQLVSEAPAAQPQLAVARVLDATGNTVARLEQMAQALSLRQSPLRLLLEPDEYQFLQTELPNVPDEELNTALRWQIKEMLRYPLDAVTLEVIPPPPDPLGQRRTNGFVVAAPNDLLRERMLMFRPWSSSVRAIDVIEMAQRNLADRLEEPGRGTAVLAITPGGCLLTASREGVPYFVRGFDLSSLALQASETLRREQLDRLVLELQRSVDVLERQLGFLNVSTLWIAPFAHAGELLSLLIDTLYLPVKLIDLATLFDCSRCPLPVDPEEQAALFHALGMALRGPGGAP